MRPVEVVIGADSCPSATMVRDLLRPLVSDDTVLRIEPLATGTLTNRVYVRDSGLDYAIEIQGTQRVHRDPARDCTERARVSAVFLALNLKAPSAEPKPSAPIAQVVAAKPASPAPPVVEKQPTPAAAPGLGLGVSAFASVAYAPGSAVAPGGGAGLWLRKRAFRLDLSGGGMAEVKLPLSPSAPGGHAELLRIPLAAMGSFLWASSRFELGPSVGVAVDLLRLRGTGLERPESALRVNAGIQAGLRTHVWLNDWLLLAGTATGSIFPRSYELRVEPQSRRASSPQVWLALQLGLECMFR